MSLADDPHRYDVEIKRLENRIGKHQKKDDLIVFYGSSSIRLWVHMKEDLAPLNVLNLGFGGSSFEWCMHHFSRLFENITPSQVVLYVGDNDLGNGAKKEDLVESYLQLREMIWRKFPNVIIDYISVKPSPARDYLIPTIKWVNKVIRDETEKHPNTHFINIYDSMLDGHNPNTNYYLSDLLHLNRKGYEVWRGVVRKHFELD